MRLGSNVFCDRTIHRDACCAGAPDFLPEREDDYLNEKGQFIRQPTGFEVYAHLVITVNGMAERGEIAELTQQRLLNLFECVKLVDAQWWDERSDEEEEGDD